MDINKNYYDKAIRQMNLEEVDVTEETAQIIKDREHHMQKQIPL